MTDHTHDPDHGETTEEERLKGHIRGLMQFMLTTRTVNTGEWMVMLAARMSEVCKELGWPERFADAGPVRDRRIVEITGHTHERT